MKNYILPLLIALFAFVGHVNAQTSYSMVVEKNDGGKVTIPTADIKQISFEENTDNPSLFQGPKHIFGNNQLKAMGCYSDYDGSERYEFTYNDKGYVTKIHYVKSDEIRDYVFEYKSDGIMYYEWRNGVLHERFPVIIGKNGFVSSIKPGDRALYTMEYNDKDQLINMSFIETDKEGNVEDSETLNLTWHNDDLEQSGWYEEGHQDDYPVLISYTTPTLDAIDNIAGVMLYYDAMGTDVDDCELMYYAGFLGKGTKRLPLTWTNTDSVYDIGDSKRGKNGNNTWTLDNAGRVIKLVNVRAWGNGNTETRTFYWEW